MSFQVFNEHVVKEEVRQMLLALKDADYALSDLDRTDIQRYADEFSAHVRVRKLKSGKNKVVLLYKALPQRPSIK